MDHSTPTKPLDRYLSKMDVWGIAFGCMVGWGVFAMPGTTFLPVAGPAGTVISMLLGMVIMLVIGCNISYLMGRSPMTGGLYTYTKEAFGRDHCDGCFLRAACHQQRCSAYLRHPGPEQRLRGIQPDHPGALGVRRL